MSRIKSHRAFIQELKSEAYGIRKENGDARSGDRCDTLRIPGNIRPFLRSNYGLNSIVITAIRLTFASLFLLIILGTLALDKLRVSKRDLPLLFLFGIFKITSDITFFYAQTTVELGPATLLRTAFDTRALCSGHHNYNIPIT